MKKLLLLTLVSLMLLSSCVDGTTEPSDVSENASDASVPAENTIIESALALVNEGKTKEAYELLYKNRDNPEAKEMLSDFTVVYSDVSIKVGAYGSLIEKEYNEHGDIISEYNEGGSYYTYEYVYDTHGRILKYSSFDKNKGLLLREYNYAYDEDGRLIHDGNVLYSINNDGEFSGNGWYYSHFYDKNGFLQKTQRRLNKTDELLDEIYYICDERGNVIKKGYTKTEFASDLYAVYEYAYNDINQLVMESEERNRRKEKTIYTYNDHGDVIKSVETVEGYKFDEEKQEYDYSQRETEVYEYNYEYEYDADGRVTKYAHIYPNGKTVTEETSYDANGNVIKYVKTSADGGVKIEEYIYDDHNNPVKTTIRTSSDSVDISETVYEYYPDGKIKKEATIRDSWTDSSEAYEYDDHGNQTYKVIKRGEKLYEYVNSYTYDENGRVITEYSDTHEYSPANFEYTYDSNGNLLKIVEKGNTDFIFSTTEYSYDEYNNVTSERRYREDGETTTHLEYVYEYDSSGNKIKEMVNNILHPSQYEEFIYKYDENGNCINKVLYKFGSVKYIRDCVYDSEGKMIKYTHYDLKQDISPYVVEYTYDEFGILISETHQYTDSPSVETYEYSDYLYFYTPNK